MILLTMLFAPAAQAAPIPPGGVQFPAVAEPDPVGATLVFSTGPVAFSAGTFSGTLRSNVWSNDATNPFGPNAYTFTYEITNDGTSGHDIERLAVSSYGGTLTDASYNPAAGVPPTLITRSLDGEVMGFNFIAPAMGAGTSSSILVVQTNVSSFALTTASLINGTSTSVLSVAPFPVPEPASVTIFALGAGTMLLRRRSR